MQLLTGNKLNAQLFQSSDSSIPTVLRFGDPSLATKGDTEIGLWDQLVEHKKRIDVLVRNIYGSDVKLELGKDYIEGLKRAKWRKEGEEPEPNTMTGNGKYVADFEEDIMGA